MRTLKKNKRKMWYSLYLGEQPKYVLDKDGNPVIAYTDKEGNVYYEDTGDKVETYAEPVEFYGNITMSGGNAEGVEFGLDLSDYSAILVMDRQELPIAETTKIWYENEPNSSTDIADYKVVKVSKGIDSDKFILRKVVK